MSMRAAGRPASSTTARPSAVDGKVLTDDPQGEGSSPTLEVARRLGLRYVAADVLSIRRRRRGRGWTYMTADWHVIRDPATIRRLNRLAVPPAYRDVLYAADPAAHLQAIGRDAAGRLQYRYHSEWEKVREIRKGRRLARLAKALPRLKRSIGRLLAAGEPTRSFAAAAVVELVACSAIRAGRESYARQRRTRGAATLLKSNVTICGRRITLNFRSKGGKIIRKEFEALRLARALQRLARLPGQRLFQYRADDSTIRRISAREVNEFLREVAGEKISLKDFRTLLACERVIELLVRVEPAKNERQRRKQVLRAVRVAADDLGNTPAICRKSYVHEAVLDAFKRRVLQEHSPSLRSPTARASLLAAIVNGATA
jgi:DNA topoisomerase-1